MNQKHQQSIHANVNVNMMVENSIQTKSAITINTDESVKI